MKFTVPGIFAGSAFLVSCSASETGASPDTNYHLSLSQVELEGKKLKLDISTNLQLPVEIMAGISLKDQKPRDIYIGMSEKRVINQSESILVLNIAGASAPLPDGDYLVEVDFYPAWGAINPKSATAPRLHDNKPISLARSGISVTDTNRRNNLQKWVYLNVDVNAPWDEAAMVQKLGTFKRSQADLSPMHDALYFHDADMTMIVNRRSGELSLWRDGKKSN